MSWRRRIDLIRASVQHGAAGKGLPRVFLATACARALDAASTRLTDSLRSPSSSSSSTTRAVILAAWSTVTADKPTGPAAALAPAELSAAAAAEAPPWDGWFGAALPGAAAPAVVAVPAAVQVAGGEGEGVGRCTTDAAQRGSKGEPRAQAAQQGGKERAAKKSGVTHLIWLHGAPKPPACFVQIGRAHV